MDSSGESSFWRNRPANARLTPARAKAALVKARAGEPLKPIEQRFVDYARQTAHEYAQEHADETARHEQALQEQNDIQRQQDVEALRNEAVQFTGADANDALSVSEWASRALDSGMSPDDIAQVAGRGKTSEKIARLAQALKQRGTEHGTDGRAVRFDREGNGGPAQEGQAPELQPARGDVAESSEPRPRGDLFPAASHADQLRAASAAKDAERNGLNRPSQPFTNTDLGATPRGEAPEQTRIPERQPSEHGESDKPSFHHADKSASGPALSAEEVDRVASGVLGADAVKANVHAVASFEKLPDAVRKAAEAEGVGAGDINAVHWKGHSYILSDMMRSAEDVRDAVFHELYTHGGLRAKYKNALEYKLRGLLDGVGGVDGVLRLAKKQNIDLSEYVKAKDPPTVLMEELMAHMSALTGTLRRIVEEYVGAVRDFLRRRGIKGFDEIGVTDLAHVLKQARQAARESMGLPADKPMFQRVFHGTPHRGIEKEGFKLNKIGTGEGAQVYGWGMYFASKREVAQAYQPRNLDAEAEMLRQYNRVERAHDYESAELWEAAMLHKHPNDIRSGDEFEHLPQAKRNVVADELAAIYKRHQKDGQLYHAEIPEDHQLLDWDKPLSEQPEVWKKLKDAGFNPFMGSDRGMVYAPHSASEARALQDAGIPGLRYLDGGSRGAGEGTHNYVIWDESHLNNDVTPYYSRRAPNEQTRTPEFKRWFGDWERGAQAKVLNGEPVAHVRIEDAPSGGYKEVEQWAAKLFADQGGKAKSPELGDVLLDERAAKDSMAHGGANAAKKAAFAAVKDVIERGTIVHRANDAQKDSYYISAPVDISGKPNIVTVLVRRDPNTQRMYLHAVTLKENLLTPRVSAADAGASEPRGSTESGDVASVLREALNFNHDEVSKAVDANGEPLTVYHGTGDEFYSFDPNKAGGSTAHMSAPLGHFLTEDRGSADRYADKASDYNPTYKRVIDAHVSIKRPFDMTTADLLKIDSQAEARALRGKLEREGYDGIHIADAKQWVAFKSEQIKSASENRGTFDPENPDIRFSRKASEDPADRADEMGRGAGGPAPDVTGVKNRHTKAERAARGLDELQAEGKRNYGRVWTAAESTLRDDPQAGIRLAAEIARKPRALTPEEQMVLAQDRARIFVERHKAAEAVNEAVAAHDAKAEAIARDRLFHANQQLETSDVAARQSGYEQGLALSVRRMMAEMDYSLEGMETRLQAAHGKPLDVEDLNKLRDLHQKMQDVESRLAGRQEAQRGKQQETRAQLTEQLKLFKQQWEQAQSRKDTTRQRQLAKQIVELRRRIDEGDYSKVVRTPIQYNEATRKLEAERNRLRGTFEEMAAKAERMNRSPVKKTLSMIHDLQMASILASLHVYKKLAYAVGGGSTHLDRQRVDAAAHEVAQGVVDKAMLLHPRLALERGAGDAHTKVSAALARVADVQMTFVDHLQGGRYERLLQPPADVVDRCRAHGRIWRNGRTVTSL